MKLQVTTKHIFEASALREDIEAKLAAALRRIESRVLRIAVRLEDVTGPRKGGVCIRCRISLRLKPSSEIIIEELADSPQAAFAVALDRLKPVVTRELGRLKRGIGAG
jgi:putative sigma-54 modulation protein